MGECVDAWMGGKSKGIKVAAGFSLRKKSRAGL